MIEINIDPVLLRLGPVMITWHGFFTAVGVLAGIWLATRFAVERGFTEDDIMSIALWCVVGGIIGARLFHVIDAWPYYAADPLAILRVNEGGLAIWGTIVGGPIAGAIYAYRHRLSIPRLLDICGLGLILGMAIGRLGDIVNGEHHGQPRGRSWSVATPTRRPLESSAVRCIWRSATSSSWDMLIFAVCTWLLYKPHHAARLDGVHDDDRALLVGQGRGAVLPPGSPFIFGLSQAQFLSLVVGASPSGSWSTSGPGPTAAAAEAEPRRPRRRG